MSHCWIPTHKWFRSDSSNSFVQQCQKGLKHTDSVLGRDSAVPRLLISKKCELSTAKFVCDEVKCSSQRFAPFETYELMMISSNV